MGQQIVKRNFRFLNDLSAINIIICICSTLNALSVGIFVVFIEYFFLILCSLSKIFFVPLGYALGLRSLVSSKLFINYIYILRYCTQVFTYVM